MLLFEKDVIHDQEMYHLEQKGHVGMDVLQNIEQENDNDTETNIVRDLICLNGKQIKKEEKEDYHNVNKNQTKYLVYLRNKVSLS